MGLLVGGPFLHPRRHAFRGRGAEIAQALSGSEVQGPDLWRVTGGTKAWRMTQDEALALLKTGASVFLTGEPGSGKTHTVNRYTDALRRHGITHAYTASTGIAATHGHGVTIHAWSGIGVRDTLSRRDLDTIAANRRIAARIEKTSVLIIDEISMLPARSLTLVDEVCRHVRGSEAPFGGMQIVLVGDFFQLPPVVRRDAHAGML